MRTLYNARVGLLTPLALPGERKRFLGMDGSCERERERRGNVWNEKDRAKKRGKRL
jgi:hypothetical protein